MPDGMKSGAGGDPFGGEPAEGTGADTDTAETDTAETDTGAFVDVDAPTGGAQNGGLPYIYARDSAKADRDMVQFFLREETKHAESQAVVDLGELLGEEPLVLDVREAAYQVALEQHLASVAARLREWGYDTQ